MEQQQVKQEEASEVVSQVPELLGQNPLESQDFSSSATHQAQGTITENPPTTQDMFVLPPQPSTFGTSFSTLLQSFARTTPNVSTDSARPDTRHNDPPEADSPNDLSSNSVPQPQLQQPPPLRMLPPIFPPSSIQLAYLQQQHFYHHQQQQLQYYRQLAWAAQQHDDWRAYRAFLTSQGQNNVPEQPPGVSQIPTMQHLLQTEPTSIPSRTNPNQNVLTAHSSAFWPSSTHAGRSLKPVTSSPSQTIGSVAQTAPRSTSSKEHTRRKPYHNKPCVAIEETGQTANLDTIICCDYCFEAKICDHSPDYVKHHRVMASLPANQVCDVCFGILESALSGRERPCAAKANYTCFKCGETFFRTDRMLAHACLHTKKKPFYCNVAGCGIMFSRKHRLTKHRKACHGLGLQDIFVCKECSSEFAHASRLQAHLKICQPGLPGVPLKPYQRGVSDEEFSDSDQSDLREKATKVHVLGLADIEPMAVRRTSSQFAAPQLQSVPEVVTQGTQATQVPACSLNAAEILASLANPARIV